MIKMSQSLSHNSYDPKVKLQHKEELEAFLAHAYEKEANELLKDVYVTDHEPKAKKFITNNKKEDEQFYRYKQALEEYNSTIKVRESKKQLKYEKGSLLQKIFDPLAGATRLENGTMFYRLEDKELSVLVKDETKLREQYDKLISGVDVVQEDDEAALRLLILDQLDENQPFSLDEFNAILDKELSVFKEGETYSYVKDIKKAF